MRIKDCDHKDSQLQIRTFETEGNQPEQKRRIMVNHMKCVKCGKLFSTAKEIKNDTTS